METLQTSTKDLISNDVLQKTMNKALQKNQERAIEKLTEFVDGHYRFKEDPPEILPIRTIFEQKNMSITPKQLSKQLELMMKTYRLSLPKERRFIIDQYTIRDIAFKVVGVGSVGTRSWVILLEGGSNQDTLILQIKEANESVLEPYAGTSIFHEHGRRVVEGLRAAQTAGDILTGWVSIPLGEGKWLDYYVRQLWDYTGAFNLAKIEANDFVGYCALCARTLAHAHAKTGNRFAIVGYLGKNGRFIQSMVQFAQAYANQNEDDYQTFLQALK